MYLICLGLGKRDLAKEKTNFLSKLVCSRIEGGGLTILKWGVTLLRMFFIFCRIFLIEFKNYYLFNNQNIGQGQTKEKNT